MSKPIAVVTGGAGFIGSHMVDLLVDHGFAVRVVDSLIGGRVDHIAQHNDNTELVSAPKYNHQPYAWAEMFGRAK